MPTPLLVDTDMALDDWMALAYLLMTPAAEVRAITVAATGEAHAGPGVKNALRLLALTDAPAVEVAAGRKTPLACDHRFPLAVRLLMDFRFGLSLPRPKGRPSSRSAVEVLRHQLEQADEPLTVLTLGPLTNLAELLEDRALLPKVAGITIMGGALDVPGNLVEMRKNTRNHHSEWNIYIDPHAANRVLRSGVPITLVPLDATNQVPLTDAFFARLSAEARSPAAMFVLRLLRRVRPLLSGEHGLCFWDPLTAALAIHPSLGRYQTRTVRVVEEENDECGRVVDDPAGAEARVCMGVDQALFEEVFLRGLHGEDVSEGVSPIAKAAHVERPTREAAES